jgi:hypothetical protein
MDQDDSHLKAIPVELDQVPGLPEAVAAARAETHRRRELAFLDVPLDICGIPVQQYRPRHLLLLSACGSPVIVGGTVLSEHIVQFLWIVRAESDADRESFCARVADLDGEQMCDAIEDYLEGARLDRPPSSTRTEREPITCYFASLTHEFALAYGWPPAQTLETPFAQLDQLWRLIVREENPKADFGNRLVTAAERACLNAYTAAAAKELP